MEIIRQIEQNIKSYVKSLDMPENGMYKNHGFLIDCCFSKALEIIEQTEIDLDKMSKAGIEGAKAGAKVRNKLV